MNIFLPCIVIFLFVSPAFAASVSEKAFVKGNISEKITILQHIDETEQITIAQKGLDFSIENAAVLGNDEEFKNLILFCVNTLPSDSAKIKKIKKKEQTKISEQLMTVFKIFDDKKIRSSVMERLPLYSKYTNELTVDFLNDYLSTAYKSGETAENVIEGAIVQIGQIGNEDSLSIVYSIWHSHIWPAYQKSIDEALVTLSKDSFSDTIKIFSISNIIEFKQYFSLLHEFQKNSQNSLCSVAENALLIAINNAEKLKATDEEKRAFSDFQIETHEVLTENKWSHAAEAISKSMLLAKQAYSEGFLREEEFVKMISSSVQIPSHELAQNLTEMLSECNGAVEKIDRIVVGDSNEKSSMPAKNVVLALIKALGELGDKTAFDTLLYVAYISYPLEVIDEAKASLAKLKW